VRSSGERQPSLWTADGAPVKRCARSGEHFCSPTRGCQLHDPVLVQVEACDYSTHVAAVETGLGNDLKLLRSAKGVSSSDTLYSSRRTFAKHWVSRIPATHATS
jgi:hypothetical protein